MQLTYRTSRILVIDNCLSLEQHNNICIYLDNVDLEFIHKQKWRRAFRLTDGSCLKGEEIFSLYLEELKESPCYPCGTAIDNLFNFIDINIQFIQGVVGNRGDSWDVYSIRPYVYPCGSGLSWHYDEGYAGAIIFYAHSRWERSWGGELLIGEEESSAEKPGTSTQFGEGIGLYIEPCPNRLTVIKGNIPHTIKKVDAPAGDNYRLSLAGFFFKRERLGLVSK